MKRFLILGTVAAVGLGVMASPAAAAKSKPDAFIKRSDEASYHGKNVYTPPDDIDDQTASSTNDADFILRVKNRGTRTDTFTVEAVGSSVGGTRAYEYKGEDVTDEVLAGTLKLRRVQPGRNSKPVTIEHDQTGAPTIVVSTVTVTSKKNPSKSATVAATTT